MSDISGLASMWRTAVVAGIVLAAHTSHADERTKFVSLVLSEVTVKQYSDGDMLVTCKVTIDNATKEDIVTKTSFASKLDGLELVITDLDGSVRAQRHYIYHQSPRHSEPRELVLKRGKTKQTMVFPMPNLGPDGKRLKVRLVGFLLASSYGHLLSTETKEIVLRGPKSGNK